MHLKAEDEKEHPLYKGINYKVLPVEQKGKIPMEKTEDSRKIEAK